MKNELVFSAGLGLVEPTGLYGDTVNGKAGVSLEAAIFLNPSWSLGLRSNYSPFSVDSSLTQGITEANYLNLDLDAHLMLYPESWFTPYLQGGVGLYRERLIRGGTTGESTTDIARVGLTAGIGLAVHRQASLFSFYSELIYQHIPAPGAARQYVRWTTGLRISFGGRPF